MRLSLFLCLFKIFLFASPFVHAAEALTLEQALAIARENNFQVKSGQQDVEIAKANLAKAKAYPNSQIDMKVGGLPHREKGINDVSREELIVEGELGQEIELWSKRGLRKKIARQGVQIAQTNQLATWQETALAVKSAFYEVLLRQNLVEIARDNLEIGKKFLGSTELKFRQNEIPLSDVLRARLELVTLRKDLSADRADYQIGRQALNLLLGRAPDVDFSIKGSFRQKALRENLEALLAQAESRRPDLAVAKIKTEQSEEAVKLAKTSRFPNPTIKLWGEKDGPEKNLGTGLGFELPLWNRQKGEIKEAVSRKNQAEIEQERIGYEVKREVRGLYLQLQTVAETIEVQRKGIDTSAELIRTSFQSYQEGKASFLKFLETMKAVNEFKKDYFSTLADWHIRRAELEKSLGNDL